MIAIAIAVSSIPLAVFLTINETTTGQHPYIPDLRGYVFSLKNLPESFAWFFLPPLIGGALVFLGLKIHAANASILQASAVLGLGCLVIIGHIAFLNWTLILSKQLT